MQNQSRTTILVLCIAIFMVHCNKSTTSPEPAEVPVAKPENPLRVGVVGLVHAHVHWILGRANDGDFDIVGIVEPNRDLAQQYSKQYGYSMDIVFDTIEEMVEVKDPEVVNAFNPTYDHLSVVEFCAPRGIHVMVEKPLAVNSDHANKMVELAHKYSIHLLTNYETSWYGSTKKAYELLNDENKTGVLQKIVFNTGHPGPIEIGCTIEFLDWLTDPILNGGGALTDFGCYGANIATWLMKGATPVSVSCITQQLKPDLYPNVEDDALIILTYPGSQVIIQASWNWSHNRKDMTIYGKTGYIFCKNGTDMEILEDENLGPYALEAEPLPVEIRDPFAYFYQVVRNNYPVGQYELASMENNLIVMQILDAAKSSAESGKVVIWDDYFPNSE